ncbi:hypothetical protein MM213_00365 [Belliella sp. R4-6]|uniref:Lipoprotein n=1 Tax=Belliella alkalica TaxID=1730871 RepID=A0ABS9V674_9BACT|nr:hypothetical protein [Belliella alkalica]MCH7411918.1 hypothetical protein [Belliella alkalica]
MKFKITLVIGLILVFGWYSYNTKIQNEEKEIKESYKKRNQYEERYREVQESRVKKLGSVLSFTLIEINEEYFSIKIKNNTKQTVRHFKFNVSLRNSFGESIGFNKSGSGFYQYESVEQNDLIHPNKSYEFSFYTRNIEEFNRYYSTHGQNLKAGFSIESVKFNNNEEYDSFIYSNFGFSKKTLEEIEKMIEKEKKKVDDLSNYF